MSIRIKNRVPVRVDFSGTKSLTQQSDKAACDIHNIIKQRTRLGVPFDLPDAKHFGNGILPSYQEAQNLIAESNQRFAALPSTLREKFFNDPARFMAFVSDPANREIMTKVGISTDHLPPEVPKSSRVDDLAAPVASPAGVPPAKPVA